MTKVRKEVFTKKRTSWVGREVRVTESEIPAYFMDVDIPGIGNISLEKDEFLDLSEVLHTVVVDMTLAEREKQLELPLGEEKE